MLDFIELKIPWFTYLRRTGVFIGLIRISVWFFLFLNFFQIVAVKLYARYSKTSEIPLHIDAPIKVVMGILMLLIMREWFVIANSLKRNISGKFD